MPTTLPIPTPDVPAPRKVMGLSFPTEAERVVVALARCRGHAMSAAATAIVAATAGAEERGDAAQIMRHHAGRYRALLDSAITEAILRTFRAECADAIVAAQSFAATLDAAAAAPPEDRALSVALLAEARDDVLPALYELTDAILARAAIDQNRVLDAIQTRNDRLGSMFKEMERVGRAIRLISLNAAVEAARAGGTTGRAFGVIATEIRALAGQAGKLLGQAREDIDAGSR